MKTLLTAEMLYNTKLNGNSAIKLSKNRKQRLGLLRSRCSGSLSTVESLGKTSVEMIKP